MNRILQQRQLATRISTDTQSSLNQLEAITHGISVLEEQARLDLTSREESRDQAGLQMEIERQSLATARAELQQLEISTTATIAGLRGDFVAMTLDRDQNRSELAGLRAQPGFTIAKLQVQRNRIEQARQNSQTDLDESRTLVLSLQSREQELVVELADSIVNLETAQALVQTHENDLEVRRVEMVSAQEAHRTEMEARQGLVGEAWDTIRRLQEQFTAHVDRIAEQRDHATTEPNAYRQRSRETIRRMGAERDNAITQRGIARDALNTLRDSTNATIETVQRERDHQHVLRDAQRANTLDLEEERVRMQTA
jgi:hypothetical protein